MYAFHTSASAACGAQVRIGSFQPERYERAGRDGRVVLRDIGLAWGR
jgi:hypothetical protein